MLETLYKRAKSGAIQYWKVSTDEEDIIKEAGQLGTASPTTHIAKAVGKNVGKKNETSAEEQAKLDAASDWRKKRDEGYKTLDDLGITETPDGLVFEINGSMAWPELNSALEDKLPKYNTDASGNVKPMLAKAVKPGYKGVTFPCYLQPKLDGVRCLLIASKIKDGAYHVTFLSRSGKPYSTLTHIMTEVMQYLSTVSDKTHFILDGEIYSEELTFQEISQAVKKQYPNSLKLKFRCYDVVSDEDQQRRAIKAQSIVESINSTHVTFVETRIITAASDIKMLHDEWVKQGYEGAMIRLMNGTYDSGQRSSSLLKVKEFDETEYDVLEFTLGEREEDLIAVCDSDAGPFKAKLMGNRATKEEIKAKYGLGKIDQTGDRVQITIKHFGFTDDGLPRFPIGKAVRDYE